MLNWYFRESCTVYEIYPQSETPHLTQIAYLAFIPSVFRLAFLLPGTVIWPEAYYRDTIVFRVWDCRLNHSISFSAAVDADNFKFKRDIEVFHFFQSAEISF